MRVTPPALNAMEINALKLDKTILISHNHYDHLDMDSITDLENSTIIVPTHLRPFIQMLDKTVELNWWQTLELDDDIKITALPAQHWSNRIGPRRNSSSWNSYIIQTSQYNIFLGCDSGYFHGFKEFGKKYHIDYAVFSVGAYHPRWFMYEQHMNIDEALTAFAEMNADKFILGHWGPFKLVNEPVGCPAVELIRKVEEYHLDADKYVIPELGGVIRLGSSNECPFTSLPSLNSPIDPRFHACQHHRIPWPQDLHHH